MQRVWRARMTIATAKLVVMRQVLYRAEIAKSAQGPACPPIVQEILNDLAYVSPRDLDDYSYVADVSTLVYATTVFDTYLQDIIELLLFMHPAAVGRSQTVDFSQLLAAQSKTAVVEATIRTKVRALGFETFSERLAFLRRQFGLKIAISEGAAEQLKHFADVRNTIVHDQGYFDLRFTDDGKVGMVQRSCARHPTPATQADTKGAIRAYSTAAFVIATEVAASVLKTALPETLATAFTSLSTEATREPAGTNTEGTKGNGDVA